METPTTPEIYNGIRGPPFRDFIRSLLKIRKFKKITKAIDLITDEEGMKKYDLVFTHPSADETKNYEFYETLGDQILNTSIVWYLFRRFPQLENPKGSDVLSRLKINLVSKKMFSELAKKLGFWPFISASVEVRSNEMKQCLEDTFEAFFGMTALLLDQRKRRGVGPSICYDIIEKIFEDVEISLKYEDLFDPKTRLGELFRDRGNTERGIGKFVYEYEKVPTQDGHELVKTLVYRNFDNRGRPGKMLVGTGTKALKKDAEQEASKEAIHNLNKLGFKKDVPQIYQELSRN